jgi:hypothetical protein
MSNNRCVSRCFGVADSPETALQSGEQATEFYGILFGFPFFFYPVNSASLSVLKHLLDDLDLEITTSTVKGL